jgi:hypothetical protein
MSFTAFILLTLTLLCLCSHESNTLTGPMESKVNCECIVIDQNDGITRGIKALTIAQVSQEYSCGISWLGPLQTVKLDNTGKFSAMLELGLESRTQLSGTWALDKTGVVLTPAGRAGMLMPQVIRLLVVVLKGRPILIRDNLLRSCLLHGLALDSCFWDQLSAPAVSEFQQRQVARVVRVIQVGSVGIILSGLGGSIAGGCYEGAAMWCGRALTTKTIAEVWPRSRVF